MSGVLGDKAVRWRRATLAERETGTKATLAERVGRRRGGRENHTHTYSTIPPSHRAVLAPRVGWRAGVRARYRAGSCGVVHHAVIMPPPCPPPSPHSPPVVAIPLPRLCPRAPPHLAPFVALWKGSGGGAVRIGGRGWGRAGAGRGFGLIMCRRAACRPRIRASVMLHRRRGHPELKLSIVKPRSMEGRAVSRADLVSPPLPSLASSCLCRNRRPSLRRRRRRHRRRCPL